MSGAVRPDRDLRYRLRRPVVRLRVGGSSQEKGASMDLGAFSISLAVKDLLTSRAFYEGLGFQVTGGDPAQKYLILVNGKRRHTSALVHVNGSVGRGSTGADLVNGSSVIGLFEEISTKELPGEGGPGHIALTDPDGNQILIDQHR